MKILEVLMKSVETNAKAVNVALSVKKTKLQLKHLICNNNSEKEFNEDKNILNASRSYNDINKSVVMLQNSVYPNKYLDGWEKLN